MLHWGNHPSRGHSWLYVKYGNEEYSTDVRGKVDLKKKYIGESMPKVMRDTYEYIGNDAFQPNVKDVTKEYTPTVNLPITNVLDAPNSYPLLCVFDVNTEWAPITLGNFKDRNFNYDKIGVNTLYVAASVEDKKIVPANYPFFIDKNKKIKFFKPNISVLKPVIITRKYPLSSPRSQREIDWIKSLDECVFQGADNPNFHNATTIYKISSFNSTHAKKIVLKQTKKFKYLRFYSNKKESFLAKLAFYDTKGVQLKGKPIKKNIIDSKWDIGAYDDDPLSFSGGTDFSLGLILSEQKNIGAIEFQPRTDNNHINVGEKYELRYWNKGWKTLGVQVAKDTVLYYNAPENSLLWLKNLTGGKQEHVFITDKNKKQQWLGSDNY